MTAAGDRLVRSIAADGGSGLSCCCSQEGGSIDSGARETEAERATDGRELARERLGRDCKDEKSPAIFV